MQTAPPMAEKLLKGRRYAVLATHNDDGSIHLTPVWYIFEDGQIFVGTSETSRKARNVLARPNASLVVDVRNIGSEAWVSASGPVNVIRGDAATAIHNRILHRYMTEDALRHPTIGPGMAAADDVVLCLQPDRWRSWDMKSLDDQYFGGLLTQTPQKWFLPLD